MATECPKCENIFKGYKCSCGYKLPYSKTHSSSGNKCAANGCPLPGSICSSTGGPKAGEEDNRTWYCRFHFGVTDATKWPEITEKINRGDLGIDVKAVPGAKAQVMASIADKGPSRWAKEVIALHEAGMYDHYQGLKMAKEFLGVE